MGYFARRSGYIGDVSYYLVDTEKAAQVVDEIVRGIDREKNSEVRVAVQNGAVFPALPIMWLRS